MAIGTSGTIGKNPSVSGGSSISSVSDIPDWPSNVSVTELGYSDGLTGNIQAQIDDKADSSHTHAASDIVSGQLAMERIYAPMALRSPSTSYDLYPVDSNTYGQIIIVDSEMSANLVTVIRIKAGVIVNIGAPGGEYVSTSPGAGECQVSISGGYFRITTGSSFSRYVGISSAQVGRV